MSLEKKLTVAIIPIATALIAVGVPVVADALSGEPTPQAAIDASPFVVENGPEGLAEIHILLRNSGERVAIVDRVVFTVTDYAEAEVEAAGRACDRPGWQSEVKSTLPFEAVLPARPTPGHQIEIAVGRQLVPGETERLRLRISTTDFSKLLITGMPSSLGASRFYRLQATVHASDTDPISAGIGLVAIPFPLPLWFAVLNAPDWGPAGRRCTQANREKLREFLKLEGARSAELMDFAADPDRLFVDRYAQEPPSAREPQAAVDLVRQYLSALAAGQFELACQMITVEGRASLGRATGSCPDGLSDYLRRLKISPATFARAELHRDSRFVRGSYSHSFAIPAGEGRVSVGLGKDWVITGFRLPPS